MTGRYTSFRFHWIVEIIIPKLVAAKTCDFGILINFRHVAFFWILGSLPLLLSQDISYGGWKQPSNSYTPINCTLKLELLKWFAMMIDIHNHNKKKWSSNCFIRQFLFPRGTSLACEWNNHSPNRFIIQLDCDIYNRTDIVLQLAKCIV